LEVLRYQIAEIDAVKIKEGEEQALEELAKKLRAAEQIEKACLLTEKAMQGGEKGRGAIYLVERAASAMLSISDAVPEAGELADRLNQIRYDLEDIADGLDEIRGDDTADVLEKLDRTEARLDAISKLKRKYGDTEGEILAFRREAAEKLDLIENADVRREDLCRELNRAETQAKETAAALSERRRSGAKALTDAVLDTLRFLDMPKVRFEVSVRPTGTLAANGFDEVEFMVSANPGEPLAPMAKIASG
jgi:DNA repair protein RecN (Recombination protein N)